MSRKVTKLKVVTPKSNALAVERLSKMMKKVRSGEVREIFAVGIHADGGMSRVWSDSSELKVFTMLGAIESAKDDFIQTELRSR